jgi:hypothetical protein
MAFHQRGITLEAIRRGEANGTGAIIGGQPMPAGSTVLIKPERLRFRLEPESLSRGISTFLASQTGTHGRNPNVAWAWRAHQWQTRN